MARRRKNPGIEAGEWIPAHAVRFNEDGTVSLMTEAPRLENVTDRALRYRANADPPPGEKICAFCGSKRFVEVGHIDGFEEHNEPENLVWTCRQCNTRMGIVFRDAGIGRRTHQYNPTKSGGALNIGEWIQAVGAITPHRGAKYAASRYGISSDMSTAQAVAMIRATPPWKRSEFANELRKHGRGRRSSEVPF